MTRRRITRALGAVASGVLGSAFLSAAVAFADDYDIVPDPNSTEVVTGYYGLLSALPAFDGTVQGYQLFDVDDTTLGTVVGTFDADESAVSNVLGGTNAELLVTEDVTGTATGDVPPVGSVFDTYNLGGSNFEYSDLASTTPGGDVISDTLVTPSGDLTIPVTFDAAAVATADIALAPLADDYDIVPVSTAVVTAVSSIPPVAVAIQGSQEFQTAAGTFDADTTATSDILGNSTEALLVTSTSGTTGTAAGDVPPVGSVFNILDSDVKGYEYVYSDLASPTPGADVISETLVTPFGDFAMPDTFDAAAVPAAGAVDVPLADGYDIVPASTETFTGINGVPPLDVAIQGTQQFDVDNSVGTVVGTFGADVSTASDSGATDAAIRVTSDGSGTTGTAAGDVPPVGSVFDTQIFGDSGFENIYSDITSTTPGGDVISDSWVTPFGDFNIPDTFDAAAVPTTESFLFLP